jgi:hypothetical protein
MRGFSVQILASALPGFRDLRAPLVAGYLWLLLLWIAVRPDLATRPTNHIAPPLYDLGKHVGPIWIGLGLSVSAYLIGSVSQVASSMIKVGFRLFENRRVKPYQFSYTDNKELLRLAESNHPIDKLTREAQLKLLRAGWNPERELDRAEMRNVESNITDRAVRARQGMWQELAMPATLLIGEETQLFTEADRLKSESDMRLAVAVPLTAICAYLIFADIWAWTFALIPIALLIVQGYDRDREFRSLMEASVIRDKIRSQSIGTFRQWVENLPPDGEPPRAAR